MSETKNGHFRLNAAEREKLSRDGYVVRERAFNARECTAIAQACEALERQVLDVNRNTRHAVGSYLFERSEVFGLNIKWEPESSDLVMGIEPFAHVSKPLNEWAHDPRLMDPCRDLIGQDDIVLFTEKINYKRARKGGPIILHQDFPYWAAFTDIASHVVTAMLFLDDANRDNGCLEVAPGTHSKGEQKRWNAQGLKNREIDTASFDTSTLMPLEVPAGSAVFFNAFLVHRSLPNKSNQDRRALLYSYQPGGNPHAREIPRPFKLTDG